MFDFLMRGPLMAAGDSGGFGGGAAVADVASDFGGDTDGSVDTGASDTGGDVHDAEFVEEGAEPAVDPVEPTQALVKAGERAVQGGKFTASGKAAIEALRAISPKLAQETTQALLTRDWFLREFPGGKKEIQQLRELAQTSGGEQGISDLQQAKNHLQNLTDWFDTSDPRFIEALTEDDDRTAAFVGLMPSMLAKFEKTAPQHFAHEQAVKFYELMTKAGIPTLFATQAAIMNRAGKAYNAGNFELAASFLAEIIDNHNAVHSFVDSIHKSANTAPPALGSPGDPKVQDREKQLTQREQSLQRQEWQTTVTGERRRLFSKSWAEVTKGRTLTSDQENTVKGFYELRMTTKMRQWQNQSERFFANGDKDGYLKEQFAFFQKSIPEALKQAMQQAMPAKPGPKAAPSGTPAVPRGTPARGPVQPPVGTIRVAKMPPTSDLDAVKTTPDMISANKAYTKDGRLVQWA